MSNGVLAGVAATRDVVFVADRDPADRVDIFRCLNSDGTERWTLRYPAPGNLDYGNSPRATALIHDDLVFLAGAQGHFHTVDLATGMIRWKKHFQQDFGGPTKLSWGFCASPLIAEGRLILQPGGPKASLVAVVPATGEVLWKSPGRPPGHSSPVLANFGNRKQIIAYDDESLGGWDLATGERLWTLKPPLAGDFNVPTPIVWGERILLSTENNGTRLYGFDGRGVVNPTPVAAFDGLSPDCESPVLVGNRLFGVSNGLYCLDPTRKLASLWQHNDESFREYVTLIANQERVLAITIKGNLILFSAAADRFEKLSELQLFDDEAGLYSHPAIVGKRFYIRGSKTLVCLDLGD